MREETISNTPLYFFTSHNRSKSGNPAQEEFGQDGKL